MPSFRVFNWNVQLMLSEFADGKLDFGGIFSDYVTSKARRVADSILGLGPFDLVALNEVFSFEAYQILIQELRPEFPHSDLALRKEDRPASDQTDDPGILEAIAKGVILQKVLPSGLALFSRHPIEFLAYTEFGWSMGFDLFAQKGCAAYCVRPKDADAIDVVLTHLQAGTGALRERIREDQVSEIRQMISDVSARSDAASHLIVCGDFNIDATSPAYRQLIRPLGDLWARDMPREDLGHTVVNDDHRIDYICHQGPTLVAEHMRICGNGSDHHGIACDLVPRRSYGTPNSAFDCKMNDPGCRLQFNLDDTDVVWVSVTSSGSMAVFPQPGTRAELYLPCHISTPQTEYRQLDGIIENQWLKTYAREHNLILANGYEYVDLDSRILLKLSDESGDGCVDALVYRKQGESPSDAIPLRPWQELFPPPSHDWSWSSPHNTDDQGRTWFRCRLGQTNDREPYESCFRLFNPAQHPVALELYRVESEDPQDPPVLFDELGPNSAATREIRYSSVGGETIFLVVRRQNRKHDGFAVQWGSPLTYLLGVPRFGSGPSVLKLQCINETGWDNFGHDEVRLYVDVPGLSLEYPSRTQSDHYRFQSSGAASTEFLAVTESIVMLGDVESRRNGSSKAVVTIDELDVGNVQTGAIRIQPLPSGDPGDAHNAHEYARKREICVDPNAKHPGIYRLSYCLSRTRPGGQP